MLFVPVQTALPQLSKPFCSECSRKFVLSVSSPMTCETEWKVANRTTLLMWIIVVIYCSILNQKVFAVILPKTRDKTIANPAALDYVHRVGPPNSISNKPVMPPASAVGWQVLPSARQAVRL